MPGYSNPNGPLIGSIEHDESRLGGVFALEFLRKVSDLVSPIMSLRGLQIGTLCEFYPSCKETMGQNFKKGEKISLRVRDPDDEDQFLPMGRVVDALLHELAHNYQTKHNEGFQDLWYRLRGEYFEFRTYGGFLGENSDSSTPSSPRSGSPDQNDDDEEEGILGWSLSSFWFCVILYALVLYINRK
ncbi:hypothetical protein MMC07_007542 [Pseudocyphellaria aurata]|nr:hypothetical protein [Pseudocyphellaria aurata]